MEHPDVPLPQATLRQEAHNAMCDWAVAKRAHKLHMQNGDRPKGMPSMDLGTVRCRQEAFLHRMQLVLGKISLDELQKRWQDQGRFSEEAIASAVSAWETKWADTSAHSHTS